MEELKGPPRPRVSGEIGRVTPLENFGPYPKWNIEQARRTSPGVRFLTLSPPHFLLHTPADWSNDSGGRDDCGDLSLLLKGGEQPWQSIQLGVFWAWAVRESKVKAAEEQGPPGLPRVQTLGLLEVLKVSMVGPYKKRMLGSLQPVSPLIQSHLHCQQLSITHIIAGFSGVQATWKSKHKWCSLPLDRWERTAPTPTFDASTSTTNGNDGSGSTRIGAEEKRSLRFLKAFSASGVQRKGAPVFLVSAEIGAATELKSRMNFR